MIKFLALIKFLAFLENFSSTEYKQILRLLQNLAELKEQKVARNFMYVKNLTQSKFDMRKKFDENARSLAGARVFIKTQELISRKWKKYD